MKSLLLVLFLATAGIAASAAQSATAGPVRLHPANPHYLSYKGVPILLLSSDQRFRAVVNRDFDYVAYFDKIASKGTNCTRIYPGSYVWLDGKGNSSAPGRQIVPWKQTKVPGAHELPGGFKYDLDQYAVQHALHDGAPAGRRQHRRRARHAGDAQKVHGELSLCGDAAG